nr:unnamed protein product [Digitaria exilis]
MAAAAARSGFRRMFSVSAFAPPKPPTPRPQADPSPNLFVSGARSLLLLLLLPHSRSPFSGGTYGGAAMSSVDLTRLGISL